MGIMGDVFRTHDLQFAAFLVTIGRLLLHLDGPPGRRQFVFAGVLEQDISDFLNGKTVDGRRLLDAHRTLKGLVLHEGDRR
ncbi:MAG: hypothetical protein A2Z31_00050 [candidate division NC10 bacterium RBG_16_65_8]|nr:MAG: hypothetical protein A2Z31_00050 [candidate division NC10 bacterium RBG_16_65_8]